MTKVTQGIEKVRDSLILEQQIKRIERTELLLESIRIQKVIRLAELRGLITKGNSG